MILSGRRAARSRRLWWLGLALTVLIPLLGVPARVEAGANHDARAATIAQALRFVAWMPGTAPGADLRVVVVGNPALAASLREACAGMQPGGRTVTVVEVVALRHLDAARPAVVVLGAMADPDLTAVVESLSRRGVVTMGDGDCPENRQLLLNLRAVGPRYRVQANQQTAARAGVNLSARLLSLAHLVE